MARIDHSIDSDLGPRATLGGQIPRLRIIPGWCRRASGLARRSSKEALELDVFVAIEPIEEMTMLAYEVLAGAIG